MVGLCITGGSDEGRTTVVGKTDVVVDTVKVVTLDTVKVVTVWGEVVLSSSVQLDSVGHREDDVGFKEEVIVSVGV